MSYAHAHTSLLLAVPPEIRIIIYGHLLDNGHSGMIAIRNKPPGCHQPQTKMSRRTKYHVLERSIVCRSYETTYGYLGVHEMHPAILAVNRQIRDEATAYLYSRHTFHFANDLEAIVPFFADKSTATLQFVRSVTLHKAVPSSTLDVDSHKWTAICNLLRALPRLSRLQLIMQGGTPRYASSWRGPQGLSVSNLQFLYDTRHDIIEWARDLGDFDALERVEIRACLKSVSSDSQTHPALVYAAFSASIETTLVEFLSAHLHIPAVAAPSN